MHREPISYPDIQALHLSEGRDTVLGEPWPNLECSTDPAPRPRADSPTVNPCTSLRVQCCFEHHYERWKALTAKDIVCSTR